MGECISIAEDGFVKLSEENLDEVGPGCFVLKEGPGESCCWVEVLSMNNFDYECVARPALSANHNHGNISEGEQVTVKREQIKALGCDRYCFC
jgi:hypothetical protein